MRTILLSDGDEELLADVLQTFIEFTADSINDNLLSPNDIEVTKHYLLDVMEFSQSHGLLEFEGFDNEYHRL
jgi:hypothetical protein